MKIFIRLFSVITEEKVMELNLIPLRNIYGDYINYLNCRSIWCDNKGRKYRVENK